VQVQIAGGPALLTAEELEAHRPGLTALCYRMLGSVFDAEDAVQETLARAWRARAGFEGRSSLRSWLYRIATNICLDSLRSQPRRARPVDLGPSSPPELSYLGEMMTDFPWVQPVPDSLLLTGREDPAEMVVYRETIRLAFIAAVQQLVPLQRAVLILHDVLGWRSREIATLLDSSAAAVNSALQRARAKLAAQPALEGKPVSEADRQLAESYLRAFEAYDLDALVQLMHDDAIQMMPPFALWLRGSGDIARWMLGPGAECRGSRMLLTAANGCPAFGQYRIDPEGGHRPWGLHVLEVSEGKVAVLHVFLGETIFEAFGLPAHLDS
jgi:RNA polymerase sigma-70 factor (ECF subfamily)